MIDKHNPQLPEKRLCAGAEQKRVEESWLIQGFHKVASLPNENWQLFVIHRGKPDTIQLGDAQTSWPSIVNVHAFPQTKNALVSQHHFSHPDLPVIRLTAHSLQEVSAYHIFHDVHNRRCNELFAVFSIDRHGKIQKMSSWDRQTTNHGVQFWSTKLQACSAWSF